MSGLVVFPKKVSGQHIPLGSEEVLVGNTKEFQSNNDSVNAGEIGADPERAREHRRGFHCRGHYSMNQDLGSGLELGREPGHEPRREPERRPGCGLGTEPWRDLLPLLENCQMANTLTQVPKGAQFTLEAERVKPKDTMP